MGVELTTKEEIHLLGYFPDEGCLAEMDKKISESLPKIENNSNFFGNQLLYDCNGQIYQIDNLLRQNALQISLDDLVEFIHLLGGIAIPAHIERDHSSIKSQIGFLNSDSKFDAVEVTRFEWKKKEYKIGKLLDGFPVISGSDSHFLEDIGTFFIEIGNDEKIVDFNSFKNYLKGIKVEKLS